MLSSISCRQALGSVADDVDSPTLPRRRLVRQHLAGCGSCAADSANYETTIALAREAYLADVQEVSLFEIDELTQAILAVRSKTTVFRKFS